MVKEQKRLRILIHGKVLQIVTGKDLDKILEEVKGLGESKSEKGRSLVIIALAYLGHLNKKNTEKILEALK